MALAELAQADGRQPALGEERLVEGGAVVLVALVHHKVPGGGRLVHLRARHLVHEPQRRHAARATSSTDNDLTREFDCEKELSEGVN